MTELELRFVWYMFLALFLGGSAGFISLSKDEFTLTQTIGYLNGWLSIVCFVIALILFFQLMAAY